MFNLNIYEMVSSPYYGIENISHYKFLWRPHISSDAVHVAFPLRWKKCVDVIKTYMIYNDRSFRPYNWLNDFLFFWNPLDPVRERSSCNKRVIWVIQVTTRMVLGLMIVFFCKILCLAGNIWQKLIKTAVQIVSRIDTDSSRPLDISLDVKPLSLYYISLLCLFSGFHLNLKFYRVQIQNMEYCLNIYFSLICPIF